MFTRTTPTWQEEIARKHREHMQRVDQEGWLKDLFRRADALTSDEPAQAATISPPAGAMVIPKSKAPVKKKGGSNGRAQSTGN